MHLEINHVLLVVAIIITARNCTLTDPLKRTESRANRLPLWILGGQHESIVWMQFWGFLHGSLCDAAALKINEEKSVCPFRSDERHKRRRRISVQINSYLHGFQSSKTRGLENSPNRTQLVTLTYEILRFK